MRLVIGGVLWARDNLECEWVLAEHIEWNQIEENEGREGVH